MRGDHPPFVIGPDNGLSDGAPREAVPPCLQQRGGGPPSQQWGVGAPLPEMVGGGGYPSGHMRGGYPPFRSVSIFADLPLPIRFRVVKEGKTLFSKDPLTLHRMKIATVREYSGL